MLRAAAIPRILSGSDTTMRLRQEIEGIVCDEGMRCEARRAPFFSPLPLFLGMISKKVHII